MSRSLINRIFAVSLAAAVSMTSTNVSAFAASTEAADKYSKNSQTDSVEYVLTGFKQLDEAVTNQTVEVGGGLSDIVFPDDLYVKACKKTGISETDSSLDETTEDPETKPDTEATKESTEETTGSDEASTEPEEGKEDNTDQGESGDDESTMIPETDGGSGGQDEQNAQSSGENASTKENDENNEAVDSEVTEQATEAAALGEEDTSSDANGESEETVEKTVILEENREAGRSVIVEELTDSGNWIPLSDITGNNKLSWSMVEKESGESEFSADEDNVGCKYVFKPDVNELKDKNGNSITLDEDAEVPEIIVEIVEADQDDPEAGITLLDANAATASFMGQIQWCDTDNGWNELIRPTTVPSDPNKLVTLWKYTGDSTDGAVQVTLQSTDPNAANYCKITATEGESIWSYTIGNVASKDGDNFYVVGPSYGSYKASRSAALKQDGEVGYEENQPKFNYINYEPDFQPLTIKKNLVPSTETGTFSFTVNVGENKVPYKGTYNVGDSGKSTTNGKIDGVSGGSSAVLQIPVGVSYEVTENNAGSYIVSYDKNKAGTMAANGNETTVTNISNNVNVSMNKKWNDNNDPTRDEDAFLRSLKLEYKLDDNETWTELNADTQKTLGIEGTLSYEIDKTGFSNWTVKGKHGSSENFPAALITEGEGGTQNVQIISYRITEDTEILTGYISQTEEDGTVTNIKSEDFEAKISWKDIDDKNNRPTSVKMTLTAYYLDGDGTRHELSEEELEAFGASKTFSVNVSKDKTETDASIESLPAYSSEGYPITYYINEETLEKYSTTYNNGETAYGTNVTQCYNGGVITNTRRAFTNYSANKQWVDAGGDISKRPTATVYLYRYKKGASADTASPVVIMDNNGKSHVISMTLPKDNECEIKFDDILANIDKVTDPETGNVTGGHKLFKYDGDGSEYIYFVKEVLTVVKDGDGNRTSASYYKEYKNVGEYESMTDALYEGGTLVNSRIPMVDVQLGKSWKTASLPDAANGTEVTLKLKVSSDGGTTWSYVKDDKNKDLTVTLSGFSADKLTRTQVVTLPKVNEEGDALLYQVEETSVKKNGTELLADDGTMTIDGHTYTFVATTLNMGDVNEPEGFDENATAELIGENRLSDEADYTVVKNWVGFENNEEKDYAVKVQVNRYLYDGTKDISFTAVDCVLTSSEISANNFKHIFEDLPLYDENGYRYDYRASEVSVTKDGTNVTKDWGTTYDYNYDLNNKKVTATLTNYRGEGGKYITVSKQWKDDGDTQHRLPVVVQVYDSEGNEWEGKTITLSETNGWTARLGFEKDELEKYNEGITVREVLVGGYDVTYGDDVSEAYTDYVNTEYTGVVCTDESAGYIYKVKNEENGDGSWLITNVRVGEVKVEIDKIWQDGNRDNDERPEVSVKVYQNGELYQNGGTATAATISLTKDNAIEGEDNKNKWTAVSDSLPKYDDDGKQYVYTIEEVDTAELKADQYVSALEDGDYDTSASKYHSGDVQHFTLTNKREGVKDYTVYKIWKDPEGTTSRPDIRISLYYSIGNDETIYAYGTGPLKDYQTEEIDYVWSTPSDADANYDRMCTVPELMAFSPEDGSEIHYYSKETMAVPGDYKTYYWTNSSCEGSVSYAGYAGEGQFIENRMEAIININGTKLWMNLQNGTKVSDLDTSKINISLYRYVGSDIPEDFDTNPSKYFVKTINLREVTTDNRKFLFSNVAKYDQNGKLYTYQMREVIEGNMGYVYRNDPNGFQITNTFVTGPENNRTIKVTKNWDSTKYTAAIASSKNTTFTYPKVTYELYRSTGKSDTDNDIDYSVAPIATITVTTSQGQQSVEGTFPAQLIWSENGVQYKYAVKEKTDGMPSYVIPDGEQTVEITDTVYSPTSMPAEKTASFTNTYDPKASITLKGSKIWEDENNVNCRPDSLTLHVYRRANGTSASTAIAEQELTEGTDYTVTWTNNDKDYTTWEYVISGDAIVQYSPNGQAFIYRIEEKVPANYTGSGQAVQSGNVTTDNVQNMTAITNSLNGTYTVSKVWDDNNNEYALRPTSVVVALQKSTDNGATWNYVTTSNNNDATTPLYTSNEGTVLAVRLSYSANKWSYTFPYLDPTCQYRGVEIAAGVSTGQAEETTYPYYLDTENGRKPMIGSYSIEYSYDDANKKTSVTNKLDPTTLNITKTWEGDSDDAYDTRPKNDAGVPTIHVKLQRANNDADLSKDDSWSDVLDASGKTVTQTLSSSTNGFTWEIKNLPKCDYSGRGYVYRAREIETEVQSYEATYSEPNANVTYITNTLNTHSAIQVNKTWHEGDTTTHPTVTIELTKWVDDNKVNYPTTMTIELDGTEDMGTKPYGESASWVATWINLPMKTNDGKQITYKVLETKIGNEETEGAAYAPDGKVAGENTVKGLHTQDEYLVNVGQTTVNFVDGYSTVDIINTKGIYINLTKTFYGDTYADRPDEITVEVQRKLETDANWEPVRKVVLDGFNNETATNSVIIGELPKYDSDNREYTYRVVETKIGDKPVVNNFASGYDVTYSSENGQGAEVRWNISNTMKTIDITGDKEWDDQNNYYGLRPENVTLELFTGTGTNLTTVAKQPKPTWTKNGNTWTYTFSDLPQYDAKGNKIVYTVKETSTTTGYSIANNSLTGDFAGAAPSTATSKTTVNVSGTYNNETHGIINKLETVNVTGKKIWTNTTNGSGTDIQPNGISLALKNGKITVTVPEESYTAPTAVNSWTYEFKAVPKYGSDGKVIKYSVEETEVPGYTTSYSDGTGGTKNVTNTLDTITVTAVKIWDDQNNVYNMRPANWDITTATAEIDGKTYSRLFSVYSDGTKMTTQPECTWTQDKTNKNKYTFTAEGLQKYKLKADGSKEAIVYTVVEEDSSVPKGYTKTVSTDGKTITNKLDTVSIAVNKTFAGDTYANRPTSVTFALMRSTDGTTWNEFKTQEVKGFSSTVATQSYTFADVPKYDTNGVLYQYKVVETKIGSVDVDSNNFASGYDVTYVKTAATGTTPDTWAFTNTMRTIDIEGTKEWDDQDNYYGLRPSDVTDVTLELFTEKDGKLAKVDKQPKPTWTKNGNTWTYTFSDLPQYDASGNKIAYTVKETSTTTGYSIANNSLTGDFAGAKDSTATSKTTVTVSGTYNEATHGIINKLETVNVTGTKTWSDNKNGSVDSIRPDNIALTLKNGETLVSVPDGTLTWTKPEGGNVWSYSFTNVPKVDHNGNEITYTVEETVVPGYTTTYDEAHKNITNTLDVISVEAVKIWNDQNNFYNMRPAGWNNTNGTGLFTVYADTVKMNPQPKCTWMQDTTDKNKYTFKVENLQQYRLDENGAKVAIVYTVQEDTVPNGYTRTVEGSTITNTLATVDVTGSKTWANTINGSGVGIQPTGITLTLKNGNTTVNVPAGKYTAPIADNNWTYKFEAVPQKDINGNDISYTVEETAVPGYTTSYSNGTDGTKNVTNTLEKTTVTAVKIWDDQSNVYGTRPDNWDITTATDKIDGKTYDRLFSVYADDAKMTAQPECTWTQDKTNTDTYTFKAEGLQKYKLVDGKEVEIVYTVKEDTIPTGYTQTETIDDKTNVKTITNTLQTTSVTVKNIWEDDNNRDGKRPDEVIFTLMWKTENGGGAAVGQKDPITMSGQEAVTSTDNNSVTWSDLPVVDKYGNTITYYVEEAKVDDYTTAYSGNIATDGSFHYEVTNSYKPGTVGAVVTKTWDDQNDKYGDRPDSITFELWSSYINDDGVKVEEKVSDFVTTGDNKVEENYVLDKPEAAGETGVSNSWTQNFTGLPQYRPGQVGKELTYYVKETKIGATEVAKKADSEEYEEAAAGYTIAISTNGESKTITNKQQTTKIKITKKWDNTDKIGTDTNEVVSATFRILRKAADGEWTQLNPDEVIVVEKDKREAELSGLPVCDRDGNEYLYKAVEIGYTLKNGTFVKSLGNITGAYAVTYGSNTGIKLNGDIFQTDVTNTLELTKAAITNYWVDDNDRDDKRPGSVTYVLKRKPVNAAVDAPGDVVGTETTLKDQKDLREYDNNIVEWDNLPVKDQAGNEYIYWIEEKDVSEYTTKIDRIESSDGSFAYKSTNTHELETITFKVKKSWDDENDYDNIRPGKVTFRLYADDDATDEGYKFTGISPVVTAKEKWTADIESNDEYTIYVYKEGAVGEPVKYSLREVNVNGYYPKTSLTYTDAKGETYKDENGKTYGLFMVTNVHEVVHGGGTDADQGSNSKPVVLAAEDKKPDLGGIGGSSLDADQGNNAKPVVVITDSQGNTKSPSQKGTPVYTPDGKLIGRIYDSDPYSVVDSKGNIVARFDPTDLKKLINNSGKSIDWTFARFTGDDSNMDMYLIMMLSSFGALFAYIADRKRRKNSK